MPEGINPKDAEGLKKAPLRLVPPSALVAMSRVMKLGGDKYGPYNWRDNSILYTVYIEAAMRHLLALADGEDKDPESGESHAAHVMACMGILIDAITVGVIKDDRYKSGKLPELLK